MKSLRRLWILTKVSAGGAFVALMQEMFTKKECAETDDVLVAMFREMLPKWSTLYEEEVQNKRCECHDCHKYGVGYMLKDEVWVQVQEGDICYLCLPCVTTRLGRDLVLEDFSDAPINEPLRWVFVHR